MRRSRVGVLGVSVVLAAGFVALAPPVGAACHAFDVEVAPAEPAEGATVEVTVTRDAAVNPSSVRVRTVDETARGGQDYEAVDRRVEFATGTEQAFSLAVLQDTADEPAETFRIELSEGDGCQVNPNFRYGQATVSIQDDDEPAAAPPSTTTPPGTMAAPATTAPPATQATTATTVIDGETTTTTGADSTSTTAAASTVSTEQADEDGTTTTSAETDAVVAAGADEDDDDGVGAAVAAVAALIVLAAAAGVGYGVRRLRSPSTR